MFALFVASFGGCEEVVFCGEEGGGGTGGDANLIVDVLNVVVYGLFGDNKYTRYLLFRVAACDQAQDFYFTLAQTHNEFATGGPYLVACRRENALHCFTIESSCTGFALQLRGSDFRCQGGAMWTWLGHCLVDIGCREYAGGRREHIRGQSTIVTRPVKSFMVECS